MANRGIYLPPELEARVVQAAAADDRSISKIIQMLAERGLAIWWKEKGIAEPIIENAEEFLAKNKVKE